MKQVILGRIRQRKAAVLMIDGKLVDLFVDADLPTIGTIYRAICDRPAKGMGGFFLKTPDGSAFLRSSNAVAKNYPLIVQVNGYAENRKAIPVTHKVVFKSRYAVITPSNSGVNLSRKIRKNEVRSRLLEMAKKAMGGSNMGLILRSITEKAKLDEIALDISHLKKKAESILSKVSDGSQMILMEGDKSWDLALRDWTEEASVIRDENAFEQYGICEQINSALGLSISLGSFASMTVEETRALVAVDIDTGGDLSPAAGLKANIAAARVLPTVLRVRGVGGQIVLDVAPMMKKNRSQFENILRASFKADEINTTMVGWTAMGHYELHRKRVRVPLRELLM
ncbi:MAG: ribonuclease E/G [Aestuariivita sp.]|nr:ribonuclease E/G [Aestuariivita sp.]